MFAQICGDLSHLRVELHVDVLLLTKQYSMLETEQGKSMLGMKWATELNCRVDARSCVEYGGGSETATHSGTADRVPLLAVPRKTRFNKSVNEVIHEGNICL